jgi:hypothetical protein
MRNIKLSDILENDCFLFSKVIINKTVILIEIFIIGH